MEFCIGDFYEILNFLKIGHNFLQDLSMFHFFRRQLKHHKKILHRKLYGINRKYVYCCVFVVTVDASKRHNVILATLPASLNSKSTGLLCTGSADIQLQPHGFERY